MDQRTYRIRAAECRVRAQTEQGFAARSALEDLARDYLRLAEGRGSDPAPPSGDGITLYVLR